VPGYLAAVDPSEPFVEACRARIPSADVRLAPAESLPFADARFDAVLSQLVLNFMPDPAVGVGEMRRVAKAKGVVAASVWDYAGEMTLLRAFWDAATALELPAARDHDEGKRMSFFNPDGLNRIWQEAGLRDVEVSALSVSAAYESFDDLWWPFEQGVGPAAAYAASLDSPSRTALADDLRRRLGSPDGSFSLAARAWCVVGRR
jgi:SAM-dependent methyltransferase